MNKKTLNGNVIVGIGSYLPERVVTNQEIESRQTDYDKSKFGNRSLDDWARNYHGAISRRWAKPGETTSDMAYSAAVRAIQDAKIDPQDIDFIILATFTSDYIFPQAAAILQAKVNKNAKFIQLDAGCTGFVDALMVGSALLDTQSLKNILIVAADKMSSMVDPTRFIPLTVFGDGAGAVILQKRPLDGFYGIKNFSLGSDGQLADYVCVPGGGSKYPLTRSMIDEGLQYIQFKFSLIKDWAVKYMKISVEEVINKSGLKIDDIVCIVPHQASSKIISTVAQELKVPVDRFVDIYPHTGNVACASIPVALDEANRKGRFKHGDWIIMPAVGAGMSWATATYRWFDYSKFKG